MSLSSLRTIMHANTLACRLAYCQAGECQHVTVTITRRTWYSGILPSMAYMREWAGIIA